MPWNRKKDITQNTLTPLAYQKKDFTTSDIQIFFLYPFPFQRVDVFFGNVSYVWQRGVGLAEPVRRGVGVQGRINRMGFRFCLWCWSWLPFLCHFLSAVAYNTGVIKYWMGGFAVKGKTRNCNFRRSTLFSCQTRFPNWSLSTWSTGAGHFFQSVHGNWTHHTRFGYQTFVSFMDWLVVFFGTENGISAGQKTWRAERGDVLDTTPWVNSPLRPVPRRRRNNPLIDRPSDTDGSFLFWGYQEVSRAIAQKAS